jgi:hypothetical protein
MRQKAGGLMDDRGVMMYLAVVAGEMLRRCQGVRAWATGKGEGEGQARYGDEGKWKMKQMTMIDKQRRTTNNGLGGMRRLEGCRR